MSTGQRALALLVASYGITTILSRFPSHHAILLFISSHTLTLYGALLFMWGSYTIVIYPRFLSPLRHLPTVPGGNLIFGHLGTMIREPSGQPQQRWARDIPNDGLIRYLWAFGVERVLPTSPKGLAEILVTRNYEFVKPRQIREGLGKLLGVGILLAEGDEHRRQRRLMMPAFAFRHVKDLYPIFWRKGQESVQAMSAALAKGPTSEDEKPSCLEVGGWASRATLDIIGLAGMGQDFNAIANPDNELNQTYRNIFKPTKGAMILGLLATILPRWFIRALPIKRTTEVEEARVKIRKVCQDLIRSKRESIDKGSRTDVDILSVLLESGGFSDEDVINQLMTFLAAGHETTASAMIWAIYLLVKHPESQKRLRQEIRDNLPSVSDLDAVVKSTDIDRLPYLSAVCNETLRLMSPVALTMRETANDTTVLNQPIPKGTTIIIVPQVANTDKSQWGDSADKFDPDRWMEPGKANSGGAESNYSFLTFLHGPRSCIGQSFAKAEFACLLATWVGKWQMEMADPNFKLEIVGGITQKPKGGLDIRFTDVEGW